MPLHLPPLPRRRFLASAMGATAGLFAARYAWSDEAALDQRRIALIADSHVWQFTDREQHRANPDENFSIVVQQILAARPRPARMIVAGDLVFKVGEPEDYRELRRRIEPLRRAGVAIDLCLGNHDDRAHFYAEFPESKPKPGAAIEDYCMGVVETEYANWFLLDSLLRTNYTPGKLGAAQVQWLADALDARRGKPAIVVAHHNLEENSKIHQGLIDSRELEDVMQARAHVRAYVHGHTHRLKFSRRAGFEVINVPATSWVFDSLQPRGWLDAQLGERGAEIRFRPLNKAQGHEDDKATIAWQAEAAASAAPAAAGG